MTKRQKQHRNAARRVLEARGWKWRGLMEKLQMAAPREYVIWRDAWDMRIDSLKNPANAKLKEAAPVEWAAYERASHRVRHCTDIAFRKYRKE